MKKDANITISDIQVPLTPNVQPVVRSGTQRTKLKDYGEDLDLENFDLIAKVIELLTTHNLWNPDDTYTFEDGERWAKFETGDEDSE